MKKCVASMVGDGPMYELVDMVHTDVVDGSDHEADRSEPQSPTEHEPESPTQTDAVGETVDDRPPSDPINDALCGIACGVCALFVATAITAVVFAFFYFAFVRSPLAAVDRMVPCECNITSHSTISWKDYGDGTSVQYIPGLGVWFAVDRGRGRDPSLQKANAKPRIRNDESWMNAAERDAYFARYPVGAVARCYYSREEYGFVAMSDESDTLTHALAWSIGITILTFLVSFCFGEGIAVWFWRLDSARPLAPSV